MSSAHSLNSTHRIEQPLRSLVAAAAVLAFMLPAAAVSQDLPERPALSPDVIATIGGRFTHGYVSAERSTQDARVRISRRGFFASRAEVFRDSPADELKTSDGAQVAAPWTRFHAAAGRVASRGHVEICDPYLADGVAKNPYVCSHAGRPADCYDVEMIQIVHGDVPGSPLASDLWSTPVTITVRNPKSSKANVARIQVRGPSQRSPIDRVPPRAGHNLLEPVVSGDGRLLVLNSGDTLLYSVMAPSAAPCDARNWTRLSHISGMHSDPAMKRYGIARYPFRDSENRKIKAGRPIRGAYPWIDRAGKNLFFAQVGGTGLFYRDRDNKLRSRFRVLNRPKKRDIVPVGATRFGVSWAGLWSEGKIVVPDTRVNNVDFDLGMRGTLPLVRLYQDQPDGVPLGRATVTRINSPENEWNYRPALLPRSPRDVVWWLSANNDMMGEVVFDDALDIGTLIFSPMNAAVENKRRAYRDGFDYKKFRGYTKTPRLQNAAASQQRWKIPAFGRVVGARTEPLAAGGRVGKGLWLDGSRSRIEYAIPEQSGNAMASATWTTTVWLDPRETGQRRRLLSYPDDSWLDLAPGRLVFGGAGGAETSVDLPSGLQPGSRRWTHLAVVSSPETFSIYVQGFKLGSWSGSYLRVRQGTIRLGRPAEATQPGFHGWVDELRVVAGARDPELMCNYAHGTLRGLDPVNDASAYTAAGVYPQASHDEVSALLSDTVGDGFSRYLCEQDRTAENACLDSIHLQSGTPNHCVREGVLFPEGPLLHDLPRPDTRSNTFCQTCHTNGHPTKSLRIGQPLAPGGSKSLTIDARRQPSQTPRRVHGFLPKALLDLPEDIEAPAEGLLLDPLMYPGSEDFLSGSNEHDESSDSSAPSAAADR